MTKAKVWCSLPLCLLFFGNACADDGRCPGNPFATYSGDIVEIYVCSNGEERLIDRLAQPREGVNLFEVERPDSSKLLIVSSSRNLRADTQSVTVTIYNIDSGEKIFRGYSKFNVSASDMNSDGIIELVLYEDFLEFDSLLLSDVGWPTIVELRDPIFIGTIEDYDSLRSRLLLTSRQTKIAFEQFCTNEEIEEAICIPPPDIKKLELFIAVLLETQ